MLRWIILAVVVVVLTAATTLVVQYLPEPATGAASAPVVERTGPQPQIEVVGETPYDFGTLSQQTNGTHSWDIKNTGEGDLEIWNDHVTCSCTSSTLKPAHDGQPPEHVTIKPGETKRVDVNWNTKTFEGKYNQAVTVGTNDPKHPTIDLGVKGTVTPPVLVFPPEAISFPTLSSEEVTRTKIAVYSPSRPELKLTKVTTSRPDLILAKTVPLTPDESKQLKTTAGYQVAIDIKPGMPLGRFNEELIIQTDHPARPELKVSIVGNVTGPISVVPDRVRMPRVASLQGASGEVTLLVRGGQETHFRVAHKPEKIEVAIAHEDTPTIKGRYRMTVKVPPGTSAGMIDDSVILKTDHPKATEVKIPISIYVSRSSDAG
jgi:hypothetical protein